MKTPTRFLTTTLLALASATLVACSGEGSPLGPTSQHAEVLAPQANLLGELARTIRNTGLLTCAPLPAAWASRLIGPAGGEIRVGPHVFRVPAGALSRPVMITAYAASDSKNHVRFQPEGLQFNIPASLTMSYANCDAVTSLLPKHIAYTNDALEILNLLDSDDNLRTKQVTSPIRHFSEYAVAW